MTEAKQGSEVEVERGLRQETLARWAEAAFGREEATSVPQRGLRLLEEAIEAFQACGGEEEIAHRLVAFVFARAPGTVGQEIGGVAVTVLLLAAAARLSADEEELREIRRVLSKPLNEFTARNEDKNAAGFRIARPAAASPLATRAACNTGTHGEGRREYCSTCGTNLGGRTLSG